ncbi:MAG: caspase family protein, partial [Candidatus Cloacimonadaceae bacterium]|nr:caspase family protein [Candidatus Cloacimonadaceae bacterium]
MKKILLVWLVLSLTLVSLGAQKALVIGNAGYALKPLKHPVLDSQLIDSTLVSIGFQVSRHSNLSETAFKTTLASFANGIGEKDLALFYFSGQAIQLDGATYLLPTGTAYADAAAVKKGAIELSALINQINKGVATLVFIDASRANPNVAFRLPKTGLAPPPSKMPAKVFLMYSTAPNTVLTEGMATFGNFASLLRQALLVPERSLGQIGTEVIDGVKDLTDQKQIPTVYNSISGDLIINA